MRARVWKTVEDQADVGMIGAAHDLPGVAMVVDVPAPGQRLVADPQPRLAARSPSSRKSAAARSMPPSATGETLEQTSIRSVPSSCIRSNLRSARSKARLRCGSGRPSKSRNGWNSVISRPRSRDHPADVARACRRRPGSRSRRSRRRQSLPQRSLELLGEIAADRNRGDRGLHAASSSTIRTSSFIM